MQWIWVDLKKKMSFLGQSWTKDCSQIHKIKCHMFYYGIFYSWLIFCKCLAQMSSVGFWVVRWVLDIKSEHLMDILNFLNS